MGNVATDDVVGVVVAVMTGVVVLGRWTLVEVDASADEAKRIVSRRRFREAEGEVTAEGSVE